MPQRTPTVPAKSISSVPPRTVAPAANRTTRMYTHLIRVSFFAYLFLVGSGDLKKSPSGSKNSVQLSTKAAAAPVRTVAHHNGIDPQQHAQLKAENIDLKEQVSLSIVVERIYFFFFADSIVRKCRN